MSSEPDVPAVTVSLIIVHLKTQDNQPYGSVRRCCEWCGIMLIGAPGEPAWTDQKKSFLNPPPGYVNCFDNRRLSIPTE